MRGKPGLLAGLRQADTVHPVSLAAVLALLMQVLVAPPLALAMAEGAAIPICLAPGTAPGSAPGRLPAPLRHDHAHCLICHLSPAMTPPPALAAALPAIAVPLPRPVRVGRAAAPPGAAAAYSPRAPPARA